MSLRRSSEPDIPDELCQELDALLVEYMSHYRRLRDMKTETAAKSTRLRWEVAAIFREHEREAERLRKRRAAIAKRFTEAWDEHFPEVHCALMPSAKVSRATRRTITVKDKRALLERLDRLDRLDLVDQVIDEAGLIKLSRTGKLDDLPKDVIVIKDAPELRVRRREED